MSQDLNKVSIDQFRLQLPFIDDSYLTKLDINLHCEIEYLSNDMEKNMKTILDYERKRSIIWKEKQSRGLKIDMEYQNFVNSHHKKRIW
ncbi:MAG: hypothetical protein GY853_16200 [PVC group bacterium]|nr:hypothetical protein [PVC group bacterium]